MKKVDYIDDNGIQRRVMLPEDSLLDPAEGIPADVFNLLEDLYQDAPAHFRSALFSHLWQLGLIEPRDYLQPKAFERYQQALRLAIRDDAFSAMSLIKEQIT